MAMTYRKPEALSDQHTHYCPGCTHGVIHRLVAEVIDELYDRHLKSIDKVGGLGDQEFEGLKDQ